MTIRTQHGWTLVDALVSILFTAILATLLHSFALVSIDVVRLREVADDLDETARIALEIIGRDVREAGYARTTTKDRGLSAATVDLVRISRDLDLDGAVDSANERVAYSLDHDDRQLLRQLGDAPPQPMVQRVDTEASSFRYFDRDGAEIAPTLLEDDAQRARVRHVEVWLSLSAPHPHPRRSDSIHTLHTTTIALRNWEL